jgi:enoyl-[acyl-carrier protein] reductase/trans-2-enoyl-CoA reductase (NAD+)
MDSWELRDSVQNKCKELWPKVTTDNLFEMSDYADYKKQFLQLFGFEVDGVDYTKDVNPDVAMDNLENML